MKYKLVPIEPTQEMIHAGQMAVSGFPRDVLERWQAMLVAAPDVDQAPVAWVSPNALSRLSHDSQVNCALVHKQHINETFPLYLHPQPAPEVAKVVESLEVAHRFIANGIELGYIQMPDSDTLDPAHETLPAIEAALAEYRAQGGDV